MKIKRVLFFTMIVAIFFIGCSNKNDFSKKTSNKPIVEVEEYENINIGYGIDIEGLNTYNAFETKHNAMSIMYDNLFIFDRNEEGIAVPNLVESYEISEDKTTYMLKLREGIKFSDGADFDADAVKCNFEIIRKNEMFSWYGVISNLKEVNVKSEYRVELVYKQPYKPALQELTMYQPLAMVSPNIIKEDTIEGMVGTGPYVLERYIKDREYIFTRNENYWGDKPKYKKLTLKIIKEPAALIMALKTGEIDMIIGSDFIPMDAFNQMKNDNTFSCKVSEEVLKTRNISMNTSSNILRDKNVRMAILHGVNKNEIVKNMFNGFEEIANSILNEKLPFCEVKLKEYDYDIEKSLKLLESAGWKMNPDTGIREKSGEKLKLTMIYPKDFIMNESLALAVKGYLREIGIEIDLKGNEMMTWYSDSLTGKFDLCIENTYGAPYDPYNILNIMLEGSSFSWALSGLKNKNEIHKAVITALTETSDEKIKESFDYILKAGNDEGIYIPISYQKDYVIFNNKKIEDYEFGGLTEMIETVNIK